MGENYQHQTTTKCNSKLHVYLRMEVISQGTFRGYPAKRALPFLGPFWQDTLDLRIFAQEASGMWRGTEVITNHRILWSVITYLWPRCPLLESKVLIWEDILIQQHLSNWHPHLTHCGLVIDTIWRQRSGSTLASSHYPRRYDISDGTKPLPEPMLSNHQWGPVPPKNNFTGSAQDINL